MQLHENALVEDVVAILYALLPASNAPATFGTIAGTLGFATTWAATEGQSKKPRIRALVEVCVLRQVLPRFLEAVVGASLGYRRAKNNPLTYNEVMSLVDLAGQLGHPAPSLKEPKFLARLAGAPTASPRPVTAPTAKPKTSATSTASDASKQKDPTALVALKERFLVLAGQEDRQAAGQALNTLLTDLFELADLAPSEPFRVVGEEIDGAFDFNHEIYLVEAKWTTAKTSAQPLYSFNEKIRRKSDYTRGIFVSINGYTDEALTAFRTGSTSRAVLIDGAHLMRVLDGGMSLAALLLKVTREFVQRGKIYLPASEL